jgi:two-component system, OmpR family, sensor histidine kinase KdpD
LGSEAIPMAELFINTLSKRRQFLYSIVLVTVVSILCYTFSSLMGYRVVALILLLTVSLIAISFDILPVLLSALLSAVIWNFFFIPPRLTFHVGATEDVILFTMYFVIAMVNAVLTYKIRQLQKVARKKEEKATTIRLYNTLLNSLSHELRTPIATIVGAADTLQAGNTNLTAEDKGILLGEISKASFRLNQQVENLLNMSRLESGFLQPKRDWCDINETVYQAVKRIEENKCTQTITVNINPELPLFRLDKGMLEQIIYNLLNNACLYTPWNSQIHIEAQCHTDILQLIIQDNGNGFSEEDIPKVFDKFYRLKDTQAGGTGLGLSIVKGFTEAMGGTIRLDNISSGGARFTLQISAETTQVNKKTEVWLKRKY